MKGSRVESFAARLDPAVTGSVRLASQLKISARSAALGAIWGTRLDEARQAAAQIKDEALASLGFYLRRFEEAATASGARVHWASDGAEACRTIVELVQRSAQPGDPVVKGKSMATEEIHLNRALESAGLKPVETDLGEFVVQLDGDAPSHIVTPIIHRTRTDVAATFLREGVSGPTQDPEELTAAARAYLRQLFQRAPVGISGANFLVAESGSVVLVENEGNNRLSTTAPRVHIVVAGIEKMIPRDADLPLFLRLLAPSSTGQPITTYTHFVRGPRKPDESDGPDEVHIVLLDNGRTRIANSDFRSILRCLRCGACLNVCPVYRQSSGHAYGHVYPGPLGAVLAPALEGLEKMGDLARASSLCGACEEVCPVAIPIPDMLLELRSRQSGGDPEWKWFGKVASSAARWKMGLRLLPMAKAMPAAALGGWGESHEPPARAGREFRRWWNGRP